MQRKTFIVAEKSYLVRKGIVSIINRLENGLVIQELDSLDLINTHLLELNPDYLVLNPNLIPQNNTQRNFTIKTDIAEKVIAISSVGPARKGMLSNFREVIHLNDSREEIFRKLNSIIDPQEDSSVIDPGSSELSEREKTILAEVARGLTNKEIAEKLFLSTHTVITHRKNITNKLGIKTISGLTVYAILNKLVDMSEIN